MTQPVDTLDNRVAQQLGFLTLRIIVLEHENAQLRQLLPPLPPAQTEAEVMP